MVLDAGRIVSCLHASSLAVLTQPQVEYGPPSELLKNEKGFLRALVDESADKDTLYAMADGKISAGDPRASSSA